MVRVNDLSRSPVAFEQSTTLVVVVELSQKSWLVAGIIPGVERQPMKKLEPDAAAVLGLIEHWRGAAIKAGQTIRRVVLAYEAGRDGFWLARWLIARGIECHSFGQCGGLARTQACQDGPPRCGNANARVAGLVAR